MIDIDHISSFVTDDASKLNIFTNTIGFSTFHKFRDNEQVIYLSDGQTGVAGLTTDAKYYVSVIDALNIKLHKTEGDSISGINTITITDYGVGIHRFKSVEKKSIISNIIVSNSVKDIQTNKEQQQYLESILRQILSILIHMVIQQVMKLNILLQDYQLMVLLLTKVM